MWPEELTSRGRSLSGKKFPSLLRGWSWTATVHALRNGAVQIPPYLPRLANFWISLLGLASFVVVLWRLEGSVYFIGFSVHLARRRAVLPATLVYILPLFRPYCQILALPRPDTYRLE